ncbi:hypothetical protein RUM44_010238 [Polyplax serrata]|uniref:Uncharacterized protein n=1 Tax=Polyplax serrata TaxID=468196 RepID=A0ABR1AV04_POLSC
MGVAILSVDVNDVEPVKAHRMNLRSRGNELESSCIVTWKWGKIFPFHFVKKKASVLDE